MSTLADFLPALLHEGRVVLRDPPDPSAGREADALAILKQAYAIYRLDVAGPLLELDMETALAAGRLVHQVCWLLLDHSEPETELEKSLVMPGLPASAAQHLSADLLLRFLPQVHRRARAYDAADRLAVLLGTVFRQWPLTGVLADVHEEPLTPLDFGGHPGLQLLYAERLARNPKAAWLPRGSGLDFAELLWREFGKDPTVLLLANQAAHSPARVGEGDDGDE